MVSGHLLLEFIEDFVSAADGSCALVIAPLFLLYYFVHKIQY
jgi:hypothetical protein